MLLVLRDIARDRLVAELAQLDPNLFGGNLVGAVADDGPVPPLRGEALGCLRDVLAALQHRVHRVGHPAQLGQDLVATTIAASAGQIGDRAGEECTCGHLRVERLGRCHAHLHVSPVGGVQHPVGLVGEIAVPAVDDADHRGPTTAHEVDRPVGVGGGTALADGNDEHVAHVDRKVETRQFGSSDCADVEPALDELVEQHGCALAGDGSSSLADDTHAADATAAQPIDNGLRNGACSERGTQQAVVLHDLAAQGLAEAEGSLADLLEEEVRIRASVDVARGHLGDGNL
ncbi:unannotated protein [freshwater metagenome]|uniref:Unannotated protein n=1 Tax=freshwater metagenome TaxID=449393 RepID=A0A6J6S7D7_9ZZZZ